MNIALDYDMAKQGSGGSPRIDSTGKYKGYIEYAKTWLTDNGARMVSVRFISDAGQEANLRMCTHSREGQPTFGFKQLQAIMACCKLRNLTETQKVLKDYNPESGQVEDMNRTVYAELENKQIGFALYRHEHDKYSAPTESTFTMEVAAPFSYQTEQVAAEVIDNAAATKLEKIVTNLSDKDTRQQSKGGSNEGYDFQAPQGGNSFDDDIPGW